MMNRYSRQVAFYGVGKEGQVKLLNKRVTIIGLGGLGSVSADHLVRSGVGHLRLVDRDYVEVINLQRQILYTEEDAAKHMPKAAAAAEHLKQINSEIEIDAVQIDVNSKTIDALIADADLVIDGTDNIETRYLINEACHEYGIPWIYGSALGSSGMTMNILPDEESPCFFCFTQSEGVSLTCAEVGILNTTTAVIASIQCTEAIKLLTGSGQPSRVLRVIDLWNMEDETVMIPKKDDCPVCVKHSYKYYGKHQV